MDKRDEEVSIIQIVCACLTEIMQIVKWRDEDIYFLSVYIHQPEPPVKYIIWRRIKNAWLMLIGREYVLYDLVLKEKDIQKLYADLGNHLKEGDDT